MENVLKLNCPCCGAKLTVDLLSNTAVCNYCGQNSLINGLITTQSNCPICGDKDQVQRVSSMMHTNDSLVQHLRIPEKPKIPSYIEFCGTKPKSDLSDPKLDATKKEIWIPIVLGLIALIAAISLFSSTSSQGGGSIVLGILFLVGAFFLFRMSYRWNIYNTTIYESKYQEYLRQIEKFHHDQEDFDEDMHDQYEKMAKTMMDRWNVAMKRWEVLYFCKRDYIIFVPGSGKYDEVKNMLKYLYLQS